MHNLTDDLYLAWVSGDLLDLDFELACASHGGIGPALRAVLPLRWLERWMVGSPLSSVRERVEELLGVYGGERDLCALLGAVRLSPVEFYAVLDEDAGLMERYVRCQGALERLLKARALGRDLISMGDIRLLQDILKTESKESDSATVFNINI